MNFPFQPGSQKIITRSEKHYQPYLYRTGRRRYAGHGRTYFKTATAAQDYARRWAERASRFLVAKESGIVS